MTGLSGTLSLPLRTEIFAPCAGTTNSTVFALDMRVGSLFGGGKW
jgi:hypothetical protein